MDADRISDGLSKAIRRQSAAFMIVEARMKDFMAAQEVGTQKEREDRRLSLIAAYETYLDAIEAAMWWHHKANGVDPENRG